MDEWSEQRALLDLYAEAWHANDPARIAACWHLSDPAPLYKAEEMERPFRDFGAIRAYWEHNRSFHASVRLAFSELQVKPVAEGVDLLVTAMRWDIAFAADARLPDGSRFPSAGKAMGGDNHVLALVARLPEGLRFRTWVEAPDAPLSYMRRLYEQAARPSGD